jgi:ATP-dependent DNA helicase RecG
MSAIDLNDSLKQIKGVGPKLAELFKRKGIDTVEDALYFIPREYEDRRHITPIAQLTPNQHATIKGRVMAAQLIRAGKKSRLQVTLSDSTGGVMLTWFHGAQYIEKEFAVGDWFLACGEVTYYAGRPAINHPDFEKMIPDADGRPTVSVHFGRIVPIYSETEGLTQKTIRRIMGQVVRNSVGELEDPLPVSIRDRLHLPNLRESFVALHFPSTLPTTPSEISPALKRVIFEEFFILQLGLGMKKQRHRAQSAPPLIDTQNLLDRYIASLPFPLTGDQQRVLAQTKADLAKAEAMARLVQGDVGSGKTVVAMGAAVIAASAGYQSALMVPTEVLAQQHLKTAKRLLEPLGISVALIAQSAAERKETAGLLKRGEIQFAIGTQALFQSGVEFSKLGLVVVDEQHRFGVEQRGLLVRKGGDKVPHMLMMTATPIPRTLALTLYGDLDLSLIREKPIGRKPVKTRVLRAADRPRLYNQIRATIGRGEQAYIIYPLVEASEKLDLKSATEMHSRLSKEVFPEYRVGLLHGRMKAEEKEQILVDFRLGKIQILISTTVIEVGIDVANATLMVIEHPERLGLSQLHQLRGRVGRGEKESECLLIAEGFVGPRLQVMEQSDDGFDIAEEDLKLRGPGEFLGTRQNGLPGFRVGHILRDSELLEVARDEAERILQADPFLQAEENYRIKGMVENRWKEKIERLRGG